MHPHLLRTILHNIGVPLHIADAPLEVEGRECANTRNKK
jgi:hypothetical protein